MIVPEGGADSVQRVTATANRLRMVLVDFADQTQDTRQEYLDEEIQRSLADVVPEQRQAFLQELLTRFPSWDARVDVTLKKTETTERSATDLRELQDPNFLVARLIELAPDLSAQDRRVLVQRLREAGLAAEGGAEWPQEGRAELQSTLQLKADAQMDLPRSLELVSLLADFAARLDQLAWNTWRAIHPRSGYHRASALREVMGRLVRVDEDVSRQQVKENLDRLGGLVAAVISAVRQAGRHASQYVARLSPSEVENLAGMEGGGLLTSKEVKCWRKYVELSRAMGPDTIEGEVREAIAKHVETLMKGR